MAKHVADVAESTANKGDAAPRTVVVTLADATTIRLVPAVSYAVGESYAALACHFEPAITATRTRRGLGGLSSRTGEIR